MKGWEELTAVKGQNTLIYLHKNNDADCMGSAILLKGFLNNLYQHKVEIIATRQPKLRWLEGIKDGILKSASLKEPDLVFIVDSRTPVQNLPKTAQKIISKAKCLIVLDHHLNVNEKAFKKLNENTFIVSRPEHTSCIEAVNEICNEMNTRQMKDKGASGAYKGCLCYPCSPEVATAALAGIYAETNGFKRPCNFRVVDELILNGADYELITQNMHKWNLEYFVYFSKVFSSAQFHNEGFVAISTSLREIHQYLPLYRYSSEEVSTPTWLLSKFRDLNVSVCGHAKKPIKGIILIYLNNKAEDRLTLVVDLIKTTKEARHELLLAGFGDIVKENQYRFFSNCNMRNLDTKLQCLKAAFDKIKY